MPEAKPLDEKIQKAIDKALYANGNPAGSVTVNTTKFAAWFCAFLICHVNVSVVVGPDVGPPFCGDPVT